MLTAIWGVVALVIATIGAFLGHWMGTRKVDAEVTKAKTVTEAVTRAAVANETAAVAGQAQVEAATSRSQTDQDAHAVADQGEDALDAALKAQGALREDQ